MTNWLGNRANEQYSYRRVKWSPGEAGHFGELESYGHITGGSVELAAFTDVKASCSFSFEGGTPPDTTDLVRIYYSFDDDDGEHAEVAVGTFFVSYGDVEYYRDGDRLVQRGSVNGSSVLSSLIDRRLGAPYTIDAGTDCINAAETIMDGFGLPTNYPESPNVLTQSAHTFKPEDSWLTVVNWLLTSANYQSAYPNAKGEIQMVPYVDPERREITATFRDDGQSIMYPEVGMANDWYETPNVVRLFHQTDDECIAASASMVRGARASLAGRGGREVTLVEEVDELDGATQADRLANLKAMARQRLIDQSAEIEKVTLTHAYVDGIVPNSAIAIEYSEMSWRGNVTNMQIELTPSTPCTTQVRRFVPNSLTITTDGGVLW